MNICGTLGKPMASLPTCPLELVKYLVNPGLTPPEIVSSQQLWQVHMVINMVINMQLLPMERHINILDSLIRLWLISSCVSDIDPISKY